MFRPKNSSPSSSSTTFQNFQGISDLIMEGSVFHQHQKLCSKRTINQYVIRLLVPSNCTAVQETIVPYLASSVYTLIESGRLFPFQKEHALLSNPMSVQTQLYSP